MRSAFLTGFLTLVSSLAAQSATLQVAHAQSLTVTVVGLGERESTRLNVMTSPVNETECMNATVTLRLTNIMVTGTMQQLDVWRANAGVDCSQVTSRQMLTRMCDPISLGSTVVLNSVDVMKNLDPIPLNALIDCTTGVSTNYSIYFLVANGAMTLEPITNYGVLALTYDSLVPPAPTGITGGSGDTSVSVTWSPVTGGEMIREQLVYGAPSSGGCDSGFFMTGQPVPDGAVLLTTVENGSGGSAMVDPTMLGLAVGESAQVAVVAVDQALNESLVGEIGCVTRVATSGFCDAYGECKSCSVSAIGVSSRPMARPLAAALLVVVGLAVARRRRVG